MSDDDAEENCFTLVLRFVEIREMSKNNTDMKFDFTQPHIKRSVRGV